MQYDIPKESFSKLEESVVAFWKDNKTFEKSLENRSGSPHFSTYDGPPFATGLPHYGHILAGTIKDVVLRYKTMKGFFVPRRFGWDTHGLPIENEVEKTLGLSGAASIVEYGIDKFNAQCEKIVLRYTQEWQETVHRMGRWVDFSNVWLTMDLTYMESVWWVLKQLWDKELVYQGFRVMPISAKLGTPLSNFEAGENYKDVDDPSVYVMFDLVDEADTALLVWTTTPWTLVSNLAAMVDESSDYVKVRDKTHNKFVILAKARIPAIYTNEEEYEVVDSFAGKSLVGKRYHPPFNYFADREDAFRVITSDAVTMEDGTGIVHTAPAFGEVDFEACKAEGIELVCPVDQNGQFTSEVPEYQGRFVKDCDKDLIRRLKESRHLFKQGTIRHRYPFCWRSDTPLIYKAVSTWFVKVEGMRDQLMQANAQIHWTPGHLKEGRFGKWLEQARDWNIARNRYWGTPIPIWMSDDGDIHVIGSIAELEELTGAKIDNLHRHHIDQLTFEKDGKKYRRIPEVFDCWFESGSMPYAQNHYPFENKEVVEETFPADFVAEGLDQTRGWFYTLTVLATALKGSPAFKNVIVNGIVLAEDGAKMSKRLRNYPDPLEVVGKYGADAIRLYLLHSPVVRGDDFRFCEKGVELVMRQVMIPLWNAFSFLLTYARIYNWQPNSKVEAVRPIDRWMVSMTQKLIHDVEVGMDAYDLSKAVEPFVGFIDQLTNWYIRLNRRRFWEMEDEEAFAILHQALVTVAKIAAPYIPFLAENLYQRLTEEESVHLTDFPHYEEEKRYLNLEEEMAAVQQVVSLGHNLRKGHQIKVRQPLRSVYIASSNAHTLEMLDKYGHLIASELNVKEVHLRPDEHEFVQVVVKPNFRVLGKKVGKQMREVQAAIGELETDKITALRNGESIEILGFELSPEDIQVDRIVKEGISAANEGDVTVALETTLDEELELEGMAREVVNKVSTMRKEADLDYTDRIVLKLQTTQRVKHAIEAHHDYVTNELLATSITFEPSAGVEWDLNGEPCTVELRKV